MAGLIISDFLEDQGLFLAHRLRYGKIHGCRPGFSLLRGDTFAVSLAQADRDYSRRRENHKAGEEQQKSSAQPMLRKSGAPA